MQSRWRSKAAWTATAMLILFVLKTIFHYEIPDADNLINLILVAGSAWGIFNNPENPDGY
jgi:hypothetical protein